MFTKSPLSQQQQHEGTLSLKYYIPADTELSAARTYVDRSTEWSNHFA